jgi:hypothetical protein
MDEGKPSARPPTTTPFRCKVCNADVVLKHDGGLIEQVQFYEGLCEVHANAAVIGQAVRAAILRRYDGEPITPHHIRRHAERLH